MRQWTNNNRIVFLDLEFFPLSDDIIRKTHLRFEIVQIGAVMLNSNFEIIDKYNAIIPPIYDSNKHTERLAEIKDSSKSISTALLRADKAITQFFDWIGITPVDIYIWDKSDFFVFKQEIEVVLPVNQRRDYTPYLNKMIDLQTIFIDALKLQQQPSLKSGTRIIHERFTGKEHNAYYDAENTARIFAKLYRSGFKVELKK